MPKIAKFYYIRERPGCFPKQPLHSALLKDLEVKFSEDSYRQRGKVMIFKNPQALRERIAEVTGREAPGKIDIFEDTSAFMSINVGDVVRLAGSDYLITAHAREGRFGIDEQPKFWVKKAVDLGTGQRKIIKMVFRETFNSKIGEVVFRCLRSPEKESEILQKIHEHPNFMHGESVRDAAGNLVRVIDFISGPSLYDYLRRQNVSHEAYYRQNLSTIMQLLIACIEGIAHLHKQGLHHGDIRADHIIINSQTGAYVWIDFDFEVGSLNYDVFGLGNVLLQAVGKGRHSLYDIRLRPSDYPDFKNTLISNDMSLMFRHRIANLRKLYPYISEALNEILMRFSVGAADPYENVDGLLEDLRFLFPFDRCNTPRAL
jgi:tRNA A-37 threonylcarbamoyl transferase component Bud32